MTGGSAAARWRADLESWAIPQEILDAAPESPWGCPVDLFARRADSRRLPTPSDERAGRRCPRRPRPGRRVRAGAGSLAGERASRLIGVDGSAGMLAAFRERAEAAGVACETVEGTWPDVAPATPAADVAICHHVVYNVPDPVPFVRALTDHARHRVVLELMPVHP